MLDDSPPPRVPPNAQKRALPLPTSHPAVGAAPKKNNGVNGGDNEQPTATRRRPPPPGHRGRAVGFQEEGENQHQEHESDRVEQLLNRHPGLQEGSTVAITTVLPQQKEKKKRMKLPAYAPPAPRNAPSVPVEESPPRILPKNIEHDGERAPTTRSATAPLDVDYLDGGRGSGSSGMSPQGHQQQSAMNAQHHYGHSSSEHNSNSGRRSAQDTRSTMVQSLRMSSSSSSSSSATAPPPPAAEDGACQSTVPAGTVVSPQHAPAPPPPDVHEARASISSPAPTRRAASQEEGTSDEDHSAQNLQTTPLTTNSTPERPSQQQSVVNIINSHTPGCTDPSPRRSVKKSASSSQQQSHNEHNVSAVQENSQARQRMQLSHHEQWQQWERLRLVGAIPTPPATEPVFNQEGAYVELEKTLSAEIARYPRVEAGWGRVVINDGSSPSSSSSTSTSSSSMAMTTAQMDALTTQRWIELRGHHVLCVYSSADAAAAGVPPLHYILLMFNGGGQKKKGVSSSGGGSTVINTENATNVKNMITLSFSLSLLDATAAATGGKNTPHSFSGTTTTGFTQHLLRSLLMSRHKKSSSSQLFPHPTEDDIIAATRLVSTNAKIVMASADAFVAMSAALVNAQSLGDVVSGSAVSSLSSEVLRRVVSTMPLVIAEGAREKNTGHGRHRSSSSTSSSSSLSDVLEKTFRDVRTISNELGMGGALKSGVDKATKKIHHLRIYDVSTKFQKLLNDEMLMFVSRHPFLHTATSVFRGKLGGGGGGANSSEAVALAVTPVLADARTKTLAQFISSVQSIRVQEQLEKRLAQQGLQNQVDNTPTTTMACEKEVWKAQDCVTNIMAELVLAVAFLHSRGIPLGGGGLALHPKRILLTPTTSNSVGGRVSIPQLHVCIPGVGFAPRGWRWQRATTGILEYLSPRVLQYYESGGNDEHAAFHCCDDWWTLGAICFELATGAKLFSQRQATSSSTQPQPPSSSSSRGSNTFANVMAADRQNRSKSGSCSKAEGEHQQQQQGTTHPTLAIQQVASLLSACSNNDETDEQQHVDDALRSFVARRFREETSCHSHDEEKAHDPWRQELLSLVVTLLDFSRTSTAEASTVNYAPTVMSEPFFAHIDWIGVFERRQHQQVGEDDGDLVGDVFSSAAKAKKVIPELQKQLQDLLLDQQAAAEAEEQRQQQLSSLLPPSRSQSILGSATNSPRRSHSSQQRQGRYNPQPRPTATHQQQQQQSAAVASRLWQRISQLEAEAFFVPENITTDGDEGEHEEEEDVFLRALMDYLKETNQLEELDRVLTDVVNRNRRRRQTAATATSSRSSSTAAGDRGRATTATSWSRPTEAAKRRHDAIRRDQARSASADSRRRGSEQSSRTSSPTVATTTSTTRTFYYYDDPHPEPEEMDHDVREYILKAHQQHTNGGGGGGQKRSASKDDRQQQYAPTDPQLEQMVEFYRGVKPRFNNEKYLPKHKYKNAHDGEPMLSHDEQVADDDQRKHQQQQARVAQPEYQDGRLVQPDWVNFHVPPGHKGAKDRYRPKTHSDFGQTPPLYDLAGRSASSASARGRRRGVSSSSRNASVVSPRRSVSGGSNLMVDASRLSRPPPRSSSGASQQSHSHRTPSPFAQVKPCVDSGKHRPAMALDDFIRLADDEHRREQQVLNRARLEKVQKQRQRFMNHHHHEHGQEEEQSALPCVHHEDPVVAQETQQSQQEQQQQSFKIVDIDDDDDGEFVTPPTSVPRTDEESQQAKQKQSSVVMVKGPAVLVLNNNADQDEEEGHVTEKKVLSSFSPSPTEASPRGYPPPQPQPQRLSSDHQHLAAAKVKAESITREEATATAGSPRHHQRQASSPLPVALAQASPSPTAAYPRGGRRQASAASPLMVSPRATEQPQSPLVISASGVATPMEQQPSSPVHTQQQSTQPQTPTAPPQTVHTEPQPPAQQQQERSLSIPTTTMTTTLKKVAAFYDVSPVEVLDLNRHRLDAFLVSMGHAQSTHDMDPMVLYDMPVPEAVVSQLPVALDDEAVDGVVEDTTTGEHRHQPQQQQDEVTEEIDLILNTSDVDGSDDCGEGVEEDSPHTSSAAVSPFVEPGSPPATGFTQQSPIINSHLGASSPPRTYEQGHESMPAACSPTVVGVAKPNDDDDDLGSPQSFVEVADAATSPLFFSSSRSEYSPSQQQAARRSVSYPASPNAQQQQERRGTPRGESVSSPNVVDASMIVHAPSPQTPGAATATNNGSSCTAPRATSEDIDVLVVEDSGNGNVVVGGTRRENNSSSGAAVGGGAVAMPGRVTPPSRRQSPTHPRRQEERHPTNAVAAPTIRGRQDTSPKGRTQQPPVVQVRRTTARSSQPPAAARPATRSSSGQRQKSNMPASSPTQQQGLPPRGPPQKPQQHVAVVAAPRRNPFLTAEDDDDDGGVWEQFDSPASAPPRISNQQNGNQLMRSHQQHGTSEEEDDDDGFVSFDEQ